MVSSIFCMPMFGYAGDKVPSPVLIPISFTLRAVCGYSFLWINNPASPIAQFMLCCLVIFSVLESVSIDVLMMRGMPNQIRGTMMGLFNFFVIFGKFSFTLTSGQAYDKIDRCAPFIYLALFDSLIVLVCLALTFCGNFGKNSR